MLCEKNIEDSMYESGKNDLGFFEAQDKVEVDTDLYLTNFRDDMPDYVYNFKRFLLSEDTFSLDVYEPTIDLIKNIDNMDHLILYYNYFDSYAFRGFRMPYYSAQLPNITINNLDMDYLTSVMYHNKPLQVVDPVSNHMFIMDDKIFDIFYMYSRFVFEEAEWWNLDLYSMLLYMENFINRGAGCEAYRVLPEALDISYDIVYMEVFHNDIYEADPYFLYNFFFYELNYVVTLMYDLNPWAYLNGEDVFSFNNLFRIFDEISLLHTYESVLQDFTYIYMTTDALFNIIGVYIYSYCLFEFMIIGFMLFICLICIMRLLKNSN